MEIPQNIRFDILLLITGVLLIAIPIYFSFLNMHLFLSTIMFLVGAYSLLLGINYIKSEYEIDTEVKQMEYILRKHRHMEYFQNTGLLTKQSKRQMEKSLKSILN